METRGFVEFCHFLADLFKEIKAFSLMLQRNDVILPQVRHNNLSSCINSGLILCILKRYLECHCGFEMLIPFLFVSKPESYFCLLF